MIYFTNPSSVSSNIPLGPQSYHYLPPTISTLPETPNEHSQSSSLGTTTANSSSPVSTSSETASPPLSKAILLPNGQSVFLPSTDYLSFITLPGGTAADTQLVPQQTFFSFFPTTGIDQKAAWDHGTISSQGKLNCVTPFVKMLLKYSYFHKNFDA